MKTWLLISRLLQVNPECSANLFCTCVRHCRHTKASEGIFVEA